jgi:hypothetical protein
MASDGFEYNDTANIPTFQDQLNEIDKNYEEAVSLIREYVEYIEGDSLHVYNQGIFNRMRDFLKRTYVKK